LLIQTALFGPNIQAKQELANQNYPAGFAYRQLGFKVCMNDDIDLGAMSYGYHRNSASRRQGLENELHRKGLDVAS
jgi:hypothetical protein